MTYSDSWARLKEVAIKRRDERARGLARLVRRAREAQQKLDLLIEYRLDYRARFDHASRSGIRGESLRNYQTFLANLEQAITQQTETITGLRQEVAAAQREVDGEHRRAESYQVIEDRRVSATLSHERRRQQKLQDELATRPLPRIVTSSEK
jgi:flagellar FliJ protein